jgi:hypothetical protein
VEPIGQLRPRGAGISQLSHLILDDLTVSGVAKAAFLLLVVTGLLVLLVPVGEHVSALVLSVIVAALLTSPTIFPAVTATKGSP